MISDWSWHLTVNIYTLNIYPRVPYFSPFRSVNSHFPDKKVVEIGNAPNNLAMNSMNFQKCTVNKELSPRGPNFSPTTSRTKVGLLYDQPFSRCKAVENRTCTEWTHWPWTPKGQSTCIHWIPNPRPKFSSVSLYETAFFEIPGCRISECTEWPQTDLKHLTFKNTLCRLNICSRRPNSTSFRLTMARFQNNRILKIKKSKTLLLFGPLRKIRSLNNLKAICERSGVLKILISDP